MFRKYQISKTIWIRKIWFKARE